MVNSMYGDHHVLVPTVPNPVGGPTEKTKQIQHELECLNKKITNLKMSEDIRLARELQAVELNIQETRRQMHLVSFLFLVSVYMFPDDNCAAFVFIPLQAVISRFLMMFTVNSLILAAPNLQT